MSRYRSQNVYLNVRFQARVLKIHVISQGLIIYLFFYEGSNVHLNHFTTIHQVMSQLFGFFCVVQ